MLFNLIEIINNNNNRPPACTSTSLWHRKLGINEWWPNVQSELDRMARNRYIYARTFFPWRLSVLCVFYVIVEKPTATPAVQQLCMVEPWIVETRWPPGHVIVRTYMPIGNKDASLLSMACLAFAINCTRIRKCLQAGRPKRQGPL